MVLEDLDGHDLVGALLPALDDLSEGAPAQELEHLVLRRVGVQHLMLDQLVVAVGGGGSLRGRAGSCGGGRPRGPRRSAPAAAPAHAAASPSSALGVRRRGSCQCRNRGRAITIPFALTRLALKENTNGF